jgi:hypothetical protein
MNDSESTGLYEQIDIYYSYRAIWEVFLKNFWKWAVFDEKSKFAEFSPATAIFIENRTTDSFLRAQNV